MKPASIFLKRALDSIDPYFTRVFLDWITKHPRYLKACFQLGRSFQRSNKIREACKKQGLQVPSVLVLSVTSKCNLHCVGCYASANGMHSKENRSIRNLSLEKWNSIIKESKKLGVFGYVVAGGEPFLVPGLIDLCLEHNDRFFLIISNGTIMNREILSRMKKVSNIGVIVSLEGAESTTDSRRGIGVYNKAMNTLRLLWKSGVLTGISVTVTRKNVDYWMRESTLDFFVENGIRIAVFIEYIPFAENQDSIHGFPSGSPNGSLVLTKEEKTAFRRFVIKYRMKKPLFLIHTPDDEKMFGGCVSSGRGFVNITPSGDVTPCPVSNLATHNICNVSLREALRSPFLNELRTNTQLRGDNVGSCVLYTNATEVERIAKRLGAYRTDTKQYI